MKSRKAVKYLVEVSGTLNDFALKILALTNIKSQINNTIIDIVTYYDSNKIDVIAYKKSEYNLKSYIEVNIGEIKHEEELESIALDVNDLSSKAKLKLNKIEDDYFEGIGNDYIIQFE